MTLFRSFGAAVVILFLFLGATGRSCSDDRGSGLAVIGGMGGGGRSGGMRTYHK